MTYSQEQPLKVMLDHSVINHAEFGLLTRLEQTSEWGNRMYSVPVVGVVRMHPHHDAEYQKQIDALFTIGRFIRSGKVRAFTYRELCFEKMRGRSSNEELHSKRARVNSTACCSALNKCRVEVCPSAIERSKFRSTVNSKEMMAKGGIDDWKLGIGLGNQSQIAFLIWLRELKESAQDTLVSQGETIGLSEFEIESLKNLALFKSLCASAQSSENYPDMFHVWTAERNALDVFLTLETKLPRIIKAASMQKRNAVKLKVEVLRPLELLKRMEISTPDEIPLKPEKFYHYHEIPPEFR